MDKNAAIQTALRWVIDKALFIDTETTGFYNDDRVTDICVVDYDGVIVFDSLINPGKPINPEAAAITGITDETVKDAPTFAQVWERLAAVIKGRTVITYNASFDTRLLSQSAFAAGVSNEWNAIANHHAQFECAMRVYADFYSEWNEGRRQNKWQKLGEAAKQCGLTLPEHLHRARADAELARILVYHMANTEPDHATSA